MTRHSCRIYRGSLRAATFHKLRIASREALTALCRRGESTLGKVPCGAASIKRNRRCIELAVGVQQHGETGAQTVAGSRTGKVE